MIVGICVVLYLGEIIPDSPVFYLLAYAPFLTSYEPWRMLTSAFLHSPTNFFHILFNMYALLAFGPTLEWLLGRWRYLVLYLLAAFAGSVAVEWIAPVGQAVVGASGALFGLFAALVIIQRGLGQNPTQLIVMIALNLVIGFIPGTNIAWQAHVGGIIAGVVVAEIYVRTRAVRQRRRQVLWIVLFGVALVALTILGVFVRTW